MNGNPKVSILVNCYNGEAFLKQALDSIYNQTYQNFEIVFVDNHSTDKSPEIAQSYGEKLLYKRTPEFMNLYSAREFGRQFLTGEYVAFLDTDDYWYPTKLEEQILYMEKEQVAFSHTLADLDFEDRKGSFFVKAYIAFKRFQNLFKSSGIMPLSKVISQYDIVLQTVVLKGELIKNTPFDGKLNLYGDFDFFVKIFETNDCLPYLIKNYGTGYRIHSNQLTNTKKDEWHKEALYLFETREKDGWSNTTLERFKLFHVDFHNYNALLDKEKTWPAFLGLAKIAASELSYLSFFIKTVILSSLKAIKR